MSTLQDSIQQLLTTKKYNDKIIAILQLVAVGKMRLPDVEATLNQIKIKK